MAEGVLFSIADGILANLASEVVKQIRLPFGVKDELRKLELTINTIKAVLLDAEEKQGTNHQVRTWLDRLEHVFHDADNLVDEFRYKQLQRRVLFGNKKAKKVRIFFSSSNQLVFCYKMAKKIKEIREALDEIKRDRDFHLDERLEETRVASQMRGRESHSFVAVDQVIGRDDDKRKLVKLLLGNNIEDKESVSIVSLIGIGGLGKTTLAQFVFNDEEVKNYFEKKMWVSVSDNFDLKSLLEKIIKSASETGLDQNYNLEQLQNKVREKIEGKRYLLVLDDVWNEDEGKWEALKTILKQGAMGSKVLITSRSMRVAQITTHSTRTHRLSGLDEGTSWALFERVAFDEELNESTAKYDRLAKVGKDIVEKCKGVPLAIKTIGRLLLSKKYSLQNLEREWINFRDTEFVEVDYKNDSDSILATLKLSYNNLPSHLKHCFAYCSLFPKDHDIDVKQLIKLWIAQGFIKPDRSKQLEEIAYDYFTTLFWGCFFQEAKADELSPRTIEYCKMHDLMHDLANLVAGKSIKILDENIGKFERNTNYTEKIRHIYVDFAHENSCQIPSLLFEQKNLCTFILCPFALLSPSDCNGVLSNFKLLRALSLRTAGNETLPNTFGQLMHLRYLDLSSNDSIKELPDSITGLYNLQTLILINCRSLVSLPADIQKLINLRRLEIDGCYHLTHVPRGIGEMTSLQTLDMFVAVDNESSESAGFGELRKLKNLRGHLTVKISGLGNRVISESGAAQYLKDKEHLDSLELRWLVEDTTVNAEEAFERLEPPKNIKGLDVCNYPGETFPIWLSLLTNLVKLRLVGCEKCKYLPPLHHFTDLKELTLHNLSALEYVLDRDNNDDRFSTSSMSSTMWFMPSLKTLIIIYCTNLKGWWRSQRQDQQHFFPDLSKLEIHTCPLLTSLPLFPNLEDLQLYEASSKPLEQTIMMKLKSESSAAASSSSSTSSLSKLKDLTINYVRDLESLLPEAIHNLSSLQSLDIRNCSGLASLPEGIGNLKSLQDLTIDKCYLASLPKEIGNLKSLQSLAIFNCNCLSTLPEEICSLSSLTYLRIEQCMYLASIPKGIGSLPSLKYVNRRSCTEIPMGDALAEYLLQQNSFA